MPTILLQTNIKAPIELVFDTSRSIGFHMQTTAKTNERAISGRTSGLIEKGETVTWEATHFGVRQQLTSVISEMEHPSYFVDEMVKGAFRSLQHTHTFKWNGTETIMKDVFKFESPYGIFGKLFNALVLTRYLKGFLIERNRMIKEFCEKQP